MTIPIIENIAVDIEAAINAITTAAGFNQDLVAVRPRRTDFGDITPENGKVLIYQGDPEESESEGLMTEDWTQPFALMAIVLDSDGASTSIDTRLNQVAADIQKKVREDRTRGGNAYDTLLKPTAKFDDGRGFSGITVVIEVKYRVQQSDPYTKV